MAQQASRTPFMEQNNHKQGRSGGKVKQMPGPAKGRRGKVNPTKGGGIFRKPNK